MHMLIRVLTPGRDSDDALAHAKAALDHLIGIGEYAAPVFDYYKTLDEDTARYRDHPRYGGIPPVLPFDSEKGRQLLEDGMDYQVEEFTETFETVKTQFDSLDVEDIMADVDGARYHCYKLGRYAGSSVFVYDEHGTGIRSPAALERRIDDYDDHSTLWVVPADVHY